MLADAAVTICPHGAVPSPTHYDNKASSHRLAIEFPLSHHDHQQDGACGWQSAASSTTGQILILAAAGFNAVVMGSLVNGGKDIFDRLLKTPAQPFQLSARIKIAQMSCLFLS